LIFSGGGGGGGISMERINQPETSQGPDSNLLPKKD
jgi:hypothetical protein